MQSKSSLRARLRSGFAIAGLAISLAGCASAGACVGRSPTYISKDDKLTDQTARKILADNEYGLELGCPGFKANR